MLALTDHLHQDVLTARGERIGRVGDLAVRLDEHFPRVTALVVEGGGDTRRVPWRQVATFESAQVALSADPQELGAEDGGERELWLARDVLDHQVVDVEGRRVARIGDVQLAREGQALRVVAVDIGRAALARRLGLRRLARRLPSEILSWDDVHLASGRGHELQLKAPTAAVHRLSPEELMHLVGRLAPPRGAEVLRSVPADSAAGALAASRPTVAAGLLRELPDPDAATILAQMPADDAAAVLRPLDAAERERALTALEPDHAGTIEPLLAHEPDTAGSIMSPDVRTAEPDEPLDEIRNRLAENPPAVDGLLTVVVVDSERRPLGVIPVVALVSGRGDPVDVPPVRTDTRLDEVIELFATYDVLALPVVDDTGALVGAVAIDDLLDVMLAERLPGARRYRVMSARRRAPA
jgi:CBS domain-containing protein/sporulation protein YlmC with PRC-barrel domain